MTSRTYTAREVADAIGITPETFYRRRRRLEMIDGLPKPISASGYHRYDRASFDAWLTRYHPMRPPAPANDPVAPLEPASIEEHRQRFALEYGSGGA